MEKNSFEKIVIICLLVNVLTIISIVILKKNLPPTIPLFYGLPVSEEELTASLGLMIPPVVSIVIILINLEVAKITKDEFIKKIFSGISISLTVLSIIAVIKTIFLVGSF